MCAKMLPVFHCQLGRVLGVKLIKAVCGIKPSSLQEWKQSWSSILVLSGLKWKSSCRAQSDQRQDLKEGRQPHLALWTNQGRGHVLHTDGVIVLCFRQRRKRSPKGTPDGAKLLISEGFAFFPTVWRSCPFGQPFSGWWANMHYKSIIPFINL